MLSLKSLEALCAKARSRGLSDDAPIKFCAGADGVVANAKIDLNSAANINAGHYLENPDSEVELEAQELTLNQ